jgi:hypothetical protein
MVSVSNSALIWSACGPLNRAKTGWPGINVMRFFRGLVFVLNGQFRQFRILAKCSQRIGVEVGNCVLWPLRWSCVCDHPAQRGRSAV